jgi:hypothetical protein
MHKIIRDEVENWLDDLFEKVQLSGHLSGHGEASSRSGPTPACFFSLERCHLLLPAAFLRRRLYSAQSILLSSRSI